MRKGEVISCALCNLKTCFIWGREDRWNKSDKSHLAVEKKNTTKRVTGWRFGYTWQEIRIDRMPFLKTVSLWGLFVGVFLKNKQTKTNKTCMIVLFVTFYNCAYLNDGSRNLPNPHTSKGWQSFVANVTSPLYYDTLLEVGVGCVLFTVSVCVVMYVLLLFRVLWFLCCCCC